MIDNKLKNYMTLEDVREKTNISLRNIKFWVEEYNIKLLKKGRKNYYSPLVVSLLNFINISSKYKYFTKKFIEVVVEYNLRNTDSNMIINDFIHFENILSDFFSKNLDLKKINLDIFHFPKNRKKMSLSKKPKIKEKPKEKKETKKVEQEESLVVESAPAFADDLL